MGYNRRNKLRLMRKVIDIYLREKKDGVTTVHIYREHIYKVYPISMATFYNYLSTPVDKLLKEYEQHEAEKKQLELFNQ